LAFETVAMERNQRLAQPFWRRIPGTPALCEEIEVGLEASEVRLSRTVWPLFFAQAIPLGERDNDVILMIQKDEFVGVRRLAMDSTNP
jgi:hypothetical protein